MGRELYAKKGGKAARRGAAGGRAARGGAKEGEQNTSRPGGAKGHQVLVYEQVANQVQGQAVRQAGRQHLAYVLISQLTRLSPCPQMSDPAPPSCVSVPSFPRSVSFPSSPNCVSSPSPPMSVSVSAPPCCSSLPGPPLQQQGVQNATLS